LDCSQHEQNLSSFWILFTDDLLGKEMPCAIFDSENRGSSQNMVITFDISKEELPIFLAEVDEHLQTLDNTLLRMQRDVADTELVQMVFRSAHTIKGMSGMIGHRRMTDVTHALENALDALRKNSIEISPPLIDLCLEAVDCLRLLRDEVATSQVSDVDIHEIVSSLKDLIAGKKELILPAKGEIAARDDVHAIDDPQKTRIFQIQARIDQNSIASAARAFQLMMTLQDLGDIQTMDPSQEEIESGTSVHDFAARLVTDQTFEKISGALTRISEIDEVLINGNVVLLDGVMVSEQSSNRVPGGPAENASSVPEQTDDLNSSQMSRKKRSANSIGRRISDLTLRMNVERLDNLMNLVGELITDRNHLHQLRGQIAAETSVSSQLERLFETITHLGRITDQLQEEVMSIRMLPLGSVFNKFPRMIHDISKTIGKVVEVIIQGEETEMDRSMIDEIYDPLIHLIRNSVDHGIESAQDRLAAGKPECGKLTLTARHEQGRIILTVADDGRGVDREKLRRSAIQKGLISAEEAGGLSEEQALDLIFVAGLSTVENVTEFSGRGVGMDIVKTNIQRVNGSIRVETWPGRGTQFQITLPLTLAIVPSLLVRVQHSTFAVPMVMVSETVRLEQSEIKWIRQKPVILLRGSVLPLIHLSDVFHFASCEEEKRHFFVVVIQLGKDRFGLIVDSLIGEEEVVVKPLGSFVGDIPGVSSATILGNGEVALIVDIFNLFKRVGV
jgi:two-component system chemotaxis sensor kinase CheA